jgi:hypothetical protein
MRNITITTAKSATYLENVGSNLEYRDHTHLKVSDDQLQAFSDAIVSFWQNVPETIFDTQVGEVPGWFEKAIQKDQADRKQGGKK